MDKKSIVLYLHVHQPWRVRDDYTVFDIGSDRGYFGEETGIKAQTNGDIFKKVAEKSYIPMNNLLEKLLKQHPEFRFSISITGTFIDQAIEFAPEVLDSFKRLVDTGRVEIVAETYYHSLAFFYDREEFETQVRAHQGKVRQIFGVETTSFRNTELSYNDQLAQWADEFDFKAILAEGWDPILQWRSPNHVYKPKGTDNIKLLLKNYKLSDDLAFRFSNQEWSEYPLTTHKYIHWLNAASYHGSLINLFMDYETFGEHQWADSGIFGFFEDFIGRWLSDSSHGFKTVTEAAEAPAVGEISMPDTVTWADAERDLTAWLGNSMQQEAMKYLYDLKPLVYNSQNGALVEDWRRLQTSDHAYYMCTKYFSDGDVHAYFSPYKTPYDAFLYYMDALRDLRFRLKDVSLPPPHIVIENNDKPLNDELQSKPSQKITNAPIKTAKQPLKHADNLHQKTTLKNNRKLGLI